MMLGRFIQGPLSEAIGWTILHSFWEGALVAVALGGVLLLTRSPRVRYGAALASLLLLIVTFAVTLDQLAPQSPAASQVITPGSVLESRDAAPIAPDTWHFSVSAIAPWLTPFWIAGVFFFYLRSMAGLIAVKRLRQRGVCCAPLAWQTRLATLSRTVRVSRPVQLLESCFVDVPLVIGYLRPVILVPVGMLAGFPAAQIEAVILHELAHIRRHDYFVNALQRAVEGLLFYHPAAWWIAGVIRSERENCCDDIAVSLTGEVHEYAAVLTALEERRWAATEWAVTATGGSLVKRIRRLLYPQNPKAAWTPFITAVFCLITIAFGLGAWQSNAGSPPSAQMERRMELAQFLMKSMSEGAPYTLVDSAEREAYLNLGSDEERMHFIVQFWLRSNPANSEADMHEEIDRRMAYADQHFRVGAGLVGSATDRGRMYVVYGAPDEIESHPANGGNNAKEEWSYRRLQGPNGMLIFRFVARNGTGDYRLMPEQAPKG